MVLRSNPPRSEWYQFLNSVIDMAERFCTVQVLYTIGGMVSLSAHTTPRQLLAVASSPEVKEVLRQYGVTTDWDFETPPGQRPTLSSFLLWVAKRRNIAGANLWVPVPFYLAGGDDPLAWRKAAGFLDTQLGLGIDFQDLDKEVAEQNREIAEYRGRFPEINSYMNRLESNLSLSAEEGEKLLQGIEELLRKRH